MLKRKYKKEDIRRSRVSFAGISRRS